MRRRTMISGSAAFVLAGASLGFADEMVRPEPLLLGVTTSTDNSGLLSHLLEAFHAKHDLEVRAITAGTGAILNMASRGDVSAVLVHAPDQEAAFVDQGYGVDRRPVMHNQFLIVGPKSDPANVRNQPAVAAAFAAIAKSETLFLSRGDESGTHQAEQRLWQAAGIDPGTMLTLNDWYRESGSGQGATLNIAANLGAYCLTDEATFATFGNLGDLVTLFSHDEALLHNPYSILLVNPARFPKINAEGATLFADWLTSKDGQAAISSFKVEGRQLFWPGANKQLAG